MITLLLLGWLFACVAFVMLWAANVRHNRTINAWQESEKEKSESKAHLNAFITLQRRRYADELFTYKLIVDIQRDEIAELQAKVKELSYE